MRCVERRSRNIVDIAIIKPLSVTRYSVLKSHRTWITLWGLPMLYVSPAMADVVADWNELAAAQSASPASVRDDVEESNVIVAVAMFQWSTPSITAMSRIERCSCHRTVTLRNLLRLWSPRTRSW